MSVAEKGELGEQVVLGRIYTRNLLTTCIHYLVPGSASKTLFLVMKAAKLFLPDECNKCPRSIVRVYIHSGFTLIAPSGLILPTHLGHQPLLLFLT